MRNRHWHFDRDIRGSGLIYSLHFRRGESFSALFSSICGKFEFAPLRILARAAKCALPAALCIAFMLALASSALANRGSPLDFTTFRLGEGAEAVLIIGGIQGDEPGGFSAATLLATRYEISRGAIWVVPNLNFPSIIKRSRGLHGDMNRKFAALDEKDPEFSTVRRIQELIRHPDVRLVLNLHDGSGYYRPNYEDKLKNPKRWGQSLIIDQEKLDDSIFMGALGKHAREVARDVNARLIKPLHAVHVHNTNTSSGDVEMEKSLSYYAVRHNKAAFGLEATKECGVAARAYYHLNMVEGFLRAAGVEFSRDFELSLEGVERALRQHLGVAFAQNRIFIPLEDARPSINYFPLPKNGAAGAITSKPIMAVLPCGGDGRLCVHYGNRTLALIRPQWLDMEEGIDGVPAIVDGMETRASFGQIVDVEEEALIRRVEGLRVNAIGLDRGLDDESEIPLRRKDFETRFSLDKGGRLFRVEVYKGKKFAGMFVLRFAAKAGSHVAGGKKRGSLPDRGGRESSLGF